MAPQLTLKQAIEQGKLKRFIRQHEDEVGDEAAFDTTLRSMAQRSKEAPATSSPDDCDD